MDRVPGAIAFTDKQRQAALSLFQYITSVTGIPFQQAADPADSNLRLVNAPPGANSIYTTWNGTPASYIVLSLDTGFANFPDPAPGTFAYTNFLHEMGHVLGLVHPSILRDATETVMTGFGCGSNINCNTPPSTFGKYDLLALRWIYGGDGFGGVRGYVSRCGSGLQ